MGTLQVTSLLLSLTALFLYINVRYIKLPNTIGLMLLSLVSAAVLGTLQFIGFDFVGEFAKLVVSSINLDAVVINGFLCLLLFVGAIHVDLESLWRERGVITALATIGVLLSTVMVGSFLYLVTSLFGLEVSYLYCLAFGALISPTDAVSVLSFLKNENLPSSIETKITGESLLNDGMSIVLFLTLLALAAGNTEGSLMMLPLAVVWDIIGAIVVGVVSGFIAHNFISHARHDNPYIAIVTTLALATGSYSVAESIGASGPIGAVIAGLFIGNHGKTFVEDDDVIHNLSNFWDLIDEILNSILFVIIGLELLAISTDYMHLLVAALTIPVVLVARFMSVFSVLRTFMRNHIDSKLSRILTWGGLRGGVSIALVLSIPAGEVREILMTATYFVVIFSVFVQGPTLTKVFCTDDC